MNLISETEKLLTILNESVILNNSSMAVKAKMKICDAKTHLQQCIDVLKDINENVVSLSEIDQTESKIGSAMAFRSQLDSGYIKDNDLNDLVELSPFLNRLFQGGISFEEMYIFSPEYLKLASLLGPNFKALERIWADWRFNCLKANHFIWMSHRGHYNSQREEIEPNVWFKKFYEIIRPIYDKETEHKILMISDLRKSLEHLSLIHSEKNPKKMVDFPEFWEPMKEGWKSFSNPKYRANNQVMIQLGKVVDHQLKEFINGGWFEAYVAFQFEDHLKRIRKPHEVYTRVKIKMALHKSVENVKVEKIGGLLSREIDVLAATDDKFAFVECKAGKLTQDEAEKALLRRDIIRAVLSEVGADPKMAVFALVHAPKVESEAVDAFLQENGMPVLAPHEVAHFARNFFT